MRMTLAVLLVGFGLVCSVPVVAHHAVGGEYDADKPVTVTGTVSRIEWVNPHARVYFDVTDPDGTVTTWSVELAARSVLTRMGWTGRSLEIGQVVTVTGDHAKSGAPMINARARETANIRAGDAEAYRAGKAEAYPITLADGTPVLYDR